MDLSCIPCKRHGKSPKYKLNDSAGYTENPRMVKLKDVLGTWMSFDVPNHVEDLCKECEKPNGDCGVGLKCLCHAKECSKCLDL
ncbi:unnamed protein product [Sphenostylis stenocarpa]|uniref:Uncharacterized protein n=1 Tax=Sphenostylis stenocarpa TaxID=92480 RepID=A0AA86SLQ8_9FABA|nr:unnamed protein product [Sphenostylis stenocarpa]